LIKTNGCTRRNVEYSIGSNSVSAHATAVAYVFHGLRYVISEIRDVVGLGRRKACALNIARPPALKDWTSKVTGLLIQRNMNRRRPLGR
jgi:hypothetical protein